VGNIVGLGQKSGIYWALNPDNGNIVWSTPVGPGSSLGGIEWVRRPTVSGFMSLSGIVTICPTPWWNQRLNTNRVATLDVGKSVQYDGAIMMAKTQITLGTEMQRRARQRANDLGVSLAEYFRRLVARDLARPETATDVDRIFDLGSSGGSDIPSQKDSVIAEAFHSTRRKLRRR